MSSCFVTIKMRINPEYEITDEGYSFRAQYKIGAQWTDSQARIIIPKRRLKDFQKLIKDDHAH